MDIFRSALSLLACVVAAQPLTATADTFPDRPITILVPFDPGGGSDRIARSVDNYTKAEFGTNFTFQYRPGAGGHIGTNLVARAKPDGYTIGTFNTPHIAVGQSAGVAQYDLDDFTFICQLASDPSVIATRKSSPFNSLEDLFAAAKAKPGTLTIGTGDQFGGTHLLALQLVEAAGVDIKVIPIKSGSQVIADTLGGHIDIGFAGLSPFLGSKGEAKFLANSGRSRHPLLPDVPTLKEKGFDLVMDNGRIFFAPKGLKAEIADRLIQGFRKIYDNPAFQNELTKQGQVPEWIPGVELKASLDGYKTAAKRLFEPLTKKK
jgi:tripartite-type tricarboxylate transporter receptor subunit TctC